MVEGHGRSFPITELTFQVRKVIGGWCGMVVACRIILSAPVPVPFHWTLDLGFGTWIWDLDLGLGFGTCFWDLDLGLDLGLTITTMKTLFVFITRKQLFHFVVFLRSI